MVVALVIWGAIYAPQPRNDSTFDQRRPEFQPPKVIRILHRALPQRRATARKGGDDLMAKTRKIGRDAKNGRFIKVEEAKRRPNTTVVETIKNPKKK